MKLSEYLETPGAAARLASDLKVSAVLISQWKTGARPIPVERCAPIERATNGQVTRQELRPNDWMDIWPELTEKAA